MCYSANASLLALILGILGQIALYSRGDLQSKALSVGFSSLTFMQLYEYILWKNPCSVSMPNNTNKFVSKVAMITNINQPFFIALSLLYFTRNSKSKEWKTLLYGTFGFLILSTFAVSQSWSQVKCTAPDGYATSGTACTPTSCGLEWEWVANFKWYDWAAYFVLLHCIILFLVKPTWPTALVTLGFIDITFFMAMGLHSKQRSLGSHWCFYAILLPWILYILPPRSSSISKNFVKL